MTDQPRTMEPHDLGCRCWPHVSEKEALEAIVQSAHAEYREGLKRVVAERKATVERIRAGLDDDAYLMQRPVGALHGPTVLDHVYALLDAEAEAAR